MQHPSQLNLTRGLMALGGGLIVLALLWALWPKPVAVESTAIGAGPLLVTVDEEGKTRIKDVYTVSAPVAGKVVRIMLETGDPVRKDASIVASIEPTAPPFLDIRAARELDAQIEAHKAAQALAEAELAQAAAELAFAESELKRAQALIGNNTISERAMERARIDAETRRAAHARAKANLEGRGSRGLLRQRPRADLGQGLAHHPGKRARGSGRHAAAGDRRSGQPRDRRRSSF